MSFARQLIKKHSVTKGFSKWLKRQNFYKAKHKRFSGLIASLKHRTALKQLKHADLPLNVVFMVFHASIWKFDRLYWKMLASKEFNPVIVICPYVLMGNDVMNKDMNAAFDWYQTNNYNVLKGIDEGNILDIKSQLKPDLMVFTNPHKLTMERFYAPHFIDVLSIYVPYGHQVCHYKNYQPQYNQVFHNIMWKIFTTNELDKQIFVDFNEKRGKNVVVSGYPGVDNLIDKTYVPKNVWKKQTSKMKKVIWAPHQTIEPTDEIYWGTFLQYAETIRDLTIEFADTIQFSMKPHPFLRHRLNKHPGWGVEKTQAYYEFWENSENTQLNEVDYIDLFLQSDALIHDSGSFLAEYLYTNKPALYMLAGDHVVDSLSPLGKMALNSHRLAYNSEAIRDFLLTTVLSGDDEMQETRSKFVSEHLKCSEQVPSEFIYEFLTDKMLS